LSCEASEGRTPSRRKADGGGEAFPQKEYKQLRTDISHLGHFLSSQPLTLQVIGTGAGAGVDSLSKRKKPKVAKTLKKRADSHQRSLSLSKGRVHVADLSPRRHATPRSGAVLGCFYFTRHFAFLRFSIKIANFSHQIDAFNDLLYSTLGQCTNKFSQL
jgi:hypothetical protein